MMLIKVVITLPDGSTKDYEGAVTPLKVASDIGKKLATDAVAAVIDGKEVDLVTPITNNCRLEIITRQSKKGLEVLRHSTAHLLAQAVKELYPGTEITIGPVIEDGFYYDIDCPITLTADDLPTIEKRMGEIASRNLEITRKDLDSRDAIRLFKDLGEKYKIELIESFASTEKISVYQQGDFVDLCRGPHLPNTSRLGKFKLISIAGAYWRGDEKNKMLCRIYGTAFADDKSLAEYLNRLEEAKKRDHRKLGPEMGLFTFLPVAPAMPFYLPKGTILYNVLIDFMRKETTAMGYQEVLCPQLMSSELWVRSGHAEHYKENMFSFEPKDGQSMALKPMNCPGHASLFAASHHSYRDLPVRYSEFTRLHRNERAGVTHGLLRTRSFSQDDGHIFLAKSQISDEALMLIKHVFSVYQAFGFSDVSVRLATRPEKFLGSAENWDEATKSLETALQASGNAFTYAPGEGAFYGPKIEFHVQDSLKRLWQCGTIQLDFSLAERFELNYIDERGKACRPVVIHRAILGSLERFIGILVEHYGGHLPLWIHPTQLVLINVTDAQQAYVRELAVEFRTWGLRFETDFRNESLSYKIRQAQLKRIPLMGIVGNEEVAAQKISVRKHTGENMKLLPIAEFKKFFELSNQPKPGGIH